MKAIIHDEKNGALCGENNLAIFGYGPLLTEPGEKIAAHVIARVPPTSPSPIESVRAKPERNGIQYLADNIDQDIVTPLTYTYRDAVLGLAGATDLRQAEKILLENGAGYKRGV